MRTFDYDVIIAGGGVTGCAIARELSRYALDICLLEREEDVCSGTSKANSAIVHAGFDAAPGSMKAQMNVAGSRLMPDLAQELDVPFRQNGSMVLCLSPDDRPALEALYRRGLTNGVEGLSLLTGEEARALEPHLTQAVAGALLASSGGIVCPFELTAALAENARANGAEVRCLEPVEALERRGEGWTVTTGRGALTSRWVVNAAGLAAGRIHGMACPDHLEIIPRRGEYLLLDKSAGSHVTRTIFQLPGRYGKGVLVTPTVHGNLLAGPTAEDIADGADTATTAAGLALVRERAALGVADIPFGAVITSFAGNRAHSSRGDFLLSETAPGFFDAAGIESPGLSAAPAIGRYVAERIASALGAALRPDFDPIRRAIPRPAQMPDRERAALIREDPRYGDIVCRCEQVSEGEILEAIRRGARSLDGVKRRVRAGMGRCQGGFCTPRVLEILARELGISPDEVCKNRPGSRLLTGTMGEADHENH